MYKVVQNLCEFPKPNFLSNSIDDYLSRSEREIQEFEKRESVSRFVLLDKLPLIKNLHEHRKIPREVLSKALLDHRVLRNQEVLEWLLENDAEVSLEVFLSSLVVSSFSTLNILKMLIRAPNVTIDTDFLIRLYRYMFRNHSVETLPEVPSYLRSHLSFFRLENFNYDLELTWYLALVCLFEIKVEDVPAPSEIARTPLGEKNPMCSICFEEISPFYFQCTSKRTNDHKMCFLCRFRSKAECPTCKVKIELYRCQQVTEK
jgi:hypothetical protein